MTRRFFGNMALAFFNEQGNLLANSRTLNPEQRIKLFEAALDSCGLPHPTTKLKPFFAHPNILSEILRLVYNRMPKEAIHSRSQSPAFSQLQKVIGKKKRTDNSISIRVLDKQGVYPNIPISCRDAKYVIHNQYPLIICKQRNYKTGVTSQLLNG